MLYNVDINVQHIHPDDAKGAHIFFYNKKIKYNDKNTLKVLTIKQKNTYL